jgi:hypothetical protein
MEDNNSNNVKTILDRLETLNEKYHSLDKSVAIIRDSMDRHFDSDATYMERTANVLESMDNTLIEFEKQIEIHIAGVKEARRQNDLLEEELKLFRKSVENQLIKVDSRVKRTEMPITVVKGMMWVVGAATALLGLYVLVRSLN